MARAAKPKPDTPSIPEPYRPLGAHGRRLWDEVHSTGDVRGSFEPLLMLCERFDERTRLRMKVARDELAEDRAGLRAIEASIVDDFERMGIRTIVPSQSQVRADDWTAQLAMLEA